MAKVYLLIQMANERFLQYTSEEQAVSIDASMIPYFGRHGCKQFIRGKSVKFGYKAWIMPMITGYCLNFDIYQGRSKPNHGQEESSPVRGLGETKQPVSRQEVFAIFDNFLRQLDLLQN
ncbi:hypothetical protein ILUMI_08035 [Ignelater luminosus]|uniref:PiggyBac transposable element-derived protein domain-containing protein n=1 Tax=Ignelater luminosus TaxID=2038154 RepID=A0A8K0GDT2_IGNLU|nr:hypothetical protein ILUMI_08035 [Ignelater luminosus]